MLSEFQKKFLKNDIFAVRTLEKYMSQPSVLRSLAAALQSILDVKCEDKLCELEKALECLEGFHTTGYGPYENKSLVYKLMERPSFVGRGSPKVKGLISYGDRHYPVDRSKLGGADK